MGAMVLTYIYQISTHYGSTRLSKPEEKKEILVAARTHEQVKLQAGLDLGTEGSPGPDKTLRSTGQNQDKNEELNWKMNSTYVRQK
jgi:hypothetical protein